MDTVKFEIPKKRRKASLDARRARAGYFFVAPFILGIILIYLPMLIDSIWFSFNKMVPTIVDGLPAIDFEYKGLEYYKYAFVESPDFVTKLIAGLDNSEICFLFHQCPLKSMLSIKLYILNMIKSITKVKFN